MDATSVLPEPPAWLELFDGVESDLVLEDPWAGEGFPSVETWAVPCCSCCVEPDAPATSPEVPAVLWDVPGLRFGDPAPVGASPCPSPVVVALQQQVGRLVRVLPAEAPAAQALVDTEVLLTVANELRVHNLARLADVHARQLHDLRDSRSSGSWLKQAAPDTDPSDLALGRKLRGFAVLDGQLQTGDLTLTAVKRLTREHWVLRQYVDRPDGLIDGQPAREVLPAVIRHVVTQVASCHLGLERDAALLVRLQGAVEQVLAEGGSDLLQLEKAYALLGAHVPASLLQDCLEELSGALLPNLLEEKAARGRDRAGMTLKRKADGSGWDVRADLDLETGELLFTVLAAEARRDSANADDTADAEVLREQGIDPSDPDGPLAPGVPGSFALPAADVPCRWPRSRARRLHDALKLLLERYLAADLAGTHDKQPVRINVTVSTDLLDGAPGAPPAAAGSGARLPRSLVRRWWCPAQVTAFLMSVGWIALGRTHSQRTLAASERTALDLQSGGHRCAGLGCCSGTPDPMTVLEPHHVEGFAQAGTTNLRDTIWACPTLHHDLHHGRTVLLRNGRRLTEQGWVD